ncbi:MurR/RpiR family transcriptional regulator [Bartonella sp. HY329]|uniref:MurR/RpiR family transcriptional regulator n=1 Tax=unclassified Bartonella TaxID=2645622 RepID=UPI0021C609B0|nr:MULTISPECIES: MurR/RpiR family transcriptional regulator [unclassified Bartonella]UXM94425.1 MurR/RpiR family transcriptional regulator [Bartonella sp. HY329]UXN08749.1 MurR/RpiR family transcriptional regulator [Bartonella sp. HY328]
MDNHVLPPLTTQEFEERLVSQSHAMPKRLQQCAEFFAAHLDRIAVATIADIAKAANVQPSAVMRFCQYFGFKGFSDLQKLYRSHFTPNWPDYKTRLEDLRQRDIETPQRLLAEFSEASRRSLENLTYSIDANMLEVATQHIANARIVHIIGLKRSYAAAAYLAYALDMIGVGSIMHHLTGELDNFATITKDDVVVVITFSPFSEVTLAMEKRAVEKGAQLVIITDAPLQHKAHKNAVVLPVTEIDFGAFRSLSATMALLLTLAVAVGTLRDRQS